MTSPDMLVPENAYQIFNVATMQDVTQESVANVQTVDLRTNLFNFKNSFFDILFGGFGDAFEVASDIVNQFIRDLVEALKGVTGGFIDLTGFLKNTEEKANNANNGVQQVTAQVTTVTQIIDTQQTLINEHDQSITELQAAFNQLTLQGNAIVFTSNNTYVPTPGVVSVDLILLGAGAGGAGGRWEVLNGGCAGGGGGGGGEVHVNVPANFLPKTATGEYAPVAITIGAGGAYGNASPTNGTGGGNTDFGGLLAAGGGQGGQVGASGGSGTGGQGGAGMIPGGKGGNGPRGAPGESGGNSTSAYDLHGGGGGGGGGGQGSAGGNGGIGGISPGGKPGPDPVRNGTPPTSIVATGGGGAAGGDTGLDTHAGAGAVPSGGGGGGYGSPSRSSNGGPGGAGMLYVIERMA